MTDENLYLLSTLIGLIIIIIGFSSLNYKLGRKLKNDERIIERLDLLINKSKGSRDQQQ